MTKHRREVVKVRTFDGPQDGYVCWKCEKPRVFAKFGDKRHPTICDICRLKRPAVSAISESDANSLIIDGFL